MDSDLATLLVAAQSGATQQNVQIAVMRKANEMGQAVLSLIDDGAQNLKTVSPPPEGMGRIVDKQA